MKITYHTRGGRSTASARLRVHKIADELRNQGHIIDSLSPYVINDAEGDPDIAVFQKVFDWFGGFDYYKQRGIRIVLDCDDLMDNIPFDLVDIVTTDAPYKQHKWSKPNVVVVPDALDIDGIAPRKYAHADKLRRAVWYGNAENSYHIRNAAAACDALDLELVVITDLNSRHYCHFDGVQGVQWEAQSVDKEIVESDLVICPYVYDGIWGIEWVKAKSANRILKAWALGLPVAATPIPSYVDAGLQYCATTVSEWIVTLDSLMHREAREYDAERGYQIAQQFTADKVALRWLEVFKG